jgi:EAL domain-containing protein (putative c-di-GMP-specific phosphodiesterase class I)/CheY-like chemotaxis protein
VTDLRPEEHARLIAFGRRKLIPRVCIADSKQHLRTFLADVLEDLGFITCECAHASDLAAILQEQQPDLVVLGVSFDGIEAGRFLEILAEESFAGSVLAIGPRESLMVKAVRRLGEEYHIAMLQPLLLPFSAETLRAAIVTLLPIEPAPSPAVDATEALKAGWLELWYQQKIDARTLVPSGVAALLRMRHPSWGVVAPAGLIPDDQDRHFRGLSEFIVGRASTDWHFLLAHQGPVDFSVKLPVEFLAEPQAVGALCRWMPQHPAFGGLTIEIDSSEIIGNLDLVINFANQTRPHNVAIAIDGLGPEWPALMDRAAFPFAELKVAPHFTRGCADDRLKQTVCRRIVEFAHGHGAQVVALGIETRIDFLTATEMGFDLVQGDLFGKPRAIRKFARSPSARPLQMSN